MKEFMSKAKKPMIFIILAALIVGYYFYLSNRKVDNNDSIAKKTPLTEITDRDLEKNYPGTPKSVVTYYSNILKVMYSGNLSDKDVENIAAQLRGIFDDELLTLNPYDEYLKRLQDEIKDYKSAGRTIADYVIENNSNMEFLTYKEKDYAKIDVMYFMHEGKNIIKNYEKFTLRKDDSGRWKILYWEVGKASDMEE